MRPVSCWSCGVVLEAPAADDDAVEAIAGLLGGKRACDECRQRMDAKHDTWLDQQLRKLIEEETGGT